MPVWSLVNRLFGTLGLNQVCFPFTIKAITDFPQPTFRKQLEEYIGMLNFYHHFVPNIASILRPLSSYVGKTKAKDSQMDTGYDLCLSDLKASIG